MASSFLACLAVLALPVAALRAEEMKPPAANGWRTLLASRQLVEIKTIDPTILVELRYAGTNNLLGHAIYEAEMPCMTRPRVARYLQTAQAILHAQGYGLKIWDAYRTPDGHRAIWRSFSRRHYVADPTDGRGSLHSWGLAVDVTLTGTDGRELTMPSAFDDFTAAASGIYLGDDPAVGARLRTLQKAMKAAGFIGLSTEWWHFAARDWKADEPLRWQPVTPHTRTRIP